MLVERELVLRVDRELETNESGSLAKRGSSKCDNRRIVEPRGLIHIFSSLCTVEILSGR